MIQFRIIYGFLIDYQFFWQGDVELLTEVDFYY